MTTRLTPALLRVENLIRPTIESMGYDVVSMRMMGSRNQKILQIMAEPEGGEREMTVNDCAKISRALSAILDVEDPIDGAYNLEVSSPGVDRPLVRPRDYQRHEGLEASIEMELPIDGRRKFRGAIVSANDDEVTLRLPEGPEVRLAYAEMLSSKLVMNDALIDFYQRKRQGQDEFNEEEYDDVDIDEDIEE